MTSISDQWYIPLLSPFPPSLLSWLNEAILLLFLFSKMAYGPHGSSHAEMGCWIWQVRSRNLRQEHCCLGPRSRPYLVTGAKFSPIGWEGQHAHCQVHKAADLQVHIASTWSLGRGHNVPTPDHVAVAALHTRSQKDERKAQSGDWGHLQSGLRDGLPQAFQFGPSNSFFLNEFI